MSTRSQQRSAAFLATFATSTTSGAPDSQDTAPARMAIGRAVQTTRRGVLAGLASTAGIAAGLTAACAPGDATGGGAKMTKSISGSLIFWPEGGQTNASYQAWVARIAEFQKVYPEAKVEMTETQDRDAKLVAAVAAGTPPDVSVYDRFIVAAAQAKGLMMDIMPYAKTAGIKGDDVQPWCWEEVFRAGKLHGLPYSTDTRMIYVNAAHLKQAGIPTTAPKTLDEFDQAMRRLNIGRPGAYERIGYIPWGNNWRLFGWGWIHGGDWLDVKANRVTMDHPKNIAALEWEVARASELGGYESVEKFRTSQPKTGLMDLLIAGTLSATINSTSQLVTVMAAKDLDWIPWAPPPAAGVNRTHTWSGGFANVLPTGIKNPDASFMLAKYLYDEEFQKIQNRSGRMPTIKSVAKDPYWNSVDPRIKQFLEMLPFSHIRPPLVQIAILNRELDGPEGAETLALKGLKPGKQSLAEANQRVNDAIKEGRAD